MKNNILPQLAIIFSLLVAFMLLSYDLDKPFIGHHDWNGVYFGNVSRNTAKFGLLATKLGAVYIFLPQSPVEFKFYTHYPPIFHLSLGLLAKFISVQEWSMRLIAIFFSLFSLYWFFLIIRHLRDWRTAFIASLFFIFNPMFLYFGKMPIHEVWGLSFIAFSLYRYIKFFEEESLKNFCWLIIGLTLACQTAWTGYYVVVLIIIHNFLYKKTKQKKIGWLFLIPLISFIGHWLYTYWLTGTWDTELIETMLFRMQIGNKAAKFAFTLVQYVKQEALWLTVYYTRVVCILSFIYSLVLLGKVSKRKTNYKDGLVLIMVIFPFLDPIIFRNVCYIHDYKLIYFLLSLPLLAALSLGWLSDRLNFLWQKNNNISFLILIVVIMLSATERIKYLKTLINSQTHKPAYELGLLLNKNNKPNQTILIGSPSFGEFSDIFVNYYSQRKNYYFQPKYVEFIKLANGDIGSIVFVKGKEQPEAALINFLNKDYNRKENKDFIIYYKKSSL